MEPERLVDPAALPDEEYAQLERRIIVAACVSALPARHARLILLRYEGDRTMEQIAEEFGVQKAAVSRMHGRILEALRAGLAERGIHSLRDVA